MRCRASFDDDPRSFRRIRERVFCLALDARRCRHTLEGKDERGILWRGRDRGKRAIAIMEEIARGLILRKSVPKLLGNP
jgi:hypothetical protein